MKKKVCCRSMLLVLLVVVLLTTTTTVVIGTHHVFKEEEENSHRILLGLANISNDNNNDGSSTDNPTRILHHPSHNYRYEPRELSVSTSGNRTRIEGLTPYEEQEEVSLEQVLERFPKAFEALIDEGNMNERDGIPQTPYIYMGFTKMGTTTIAGFWECVGRDNLKVNYTKTCHYRMKGDLRQRSIEYCLIHNGIKQNLPLLETCGYPNRCTGYAQIDDSTYGRIGQIDHLKTFIKEQPQLTLFLPFRNFKNWINSQINWQLKGRADLISSRDISSPYPGLDAFDNVNFISNDNNRQYLHDDIISKKERQLNAQNEFLYECIHNQSNQHTNEAVEIFRTIDKLRGNDRLGRLALFWVYYVTYIRSFSSINHIRLIEFDLEHPNTGEYLLDIFHIPKDSIKRKMCWKHIIP